MKPWVEGLLTQPELARWAPDRPWSAAQREQHVLFMHHPVKPEAIRSLVPPALDLQIVDGTAWLAVIALEVADVTARRLPVPPWLRRFAEVDLLVRKGCIQREREPRPRRHPVLVHPRAVLAADGQHDRGVQARE